MPCCRKAAVDPGPWPGAGLPIPYKQGCCCSRLLFTWFTPLIAVGATRPLTEADSWVSPLPDQCSVLAAELSRHIARIQATRAAKAAKRAATRGHSGGEGPATRGSTGEGRWVLLRALVSVRWGAFCLCALLKLTAESLDFAGPLLLGLLLEFVQNPATYDPATPYCVAGAIFLAAALRVVVLQNYIQLTMHIGANRGTAAMGGIYRKVLTMRVGQGGSTTGQVTNLMSNDCQRIVQASGLFQNFWFQPVLCVVCMVLLFVYVGISGIVGSICMALFVRSR